MKKQWVLSVAVLLLSLIFVFPAYAKVVYVKTDGLDANDGSSWELAKQTVQAGLDAAVSGDEVWVAAGTYVGCITLVDGVKLYGGYAGVGDTRDPKAYETVLDGNQAGSVVTSPYYATEETKIDGFTIKNGSGTLFSNEHVYGGGIYCSYSSPTISNNTISGNSASTNGGGIYCNSSSLIISSNMIYGNSAYRGGGIYCNQSKTPTISNNTISGNSASTSGGGIYCKSSSLTISSNTISGNNANGGGGIYCDNSQTPMISNNNITGNIGGGIGCYFSTSPTISNNTISSNKSVGGGGAGGIFCYSSSPAIFNNIISGNSTSYGSGGIICHNSSPLISNNTIVSNVGDGSYSGGIDCKDFSSPSITNNIIAFNSSGIHKTSSNEMPVLQNNCVYGNTTYDYLDLSVGAGDISADPMLADLGYGNIHLQPGSPCIDTGVDNIIQPEWLDIDSQTRLQGTHIDIGADESDSTVWPHGPYTIIRVSPVGNDANDGSTWMLAKKTVQAGIDSSYGKGGEVWVAAGTYNERIILHSYAHVYGGFAGSENTRDERDWELNEAILDGNAEGSVVTISGSMPSLIIIDGLTIHNGNKSGIYCNKYSSPVISNNNICGNSNTIFGGGIYCDYYSSPFISKNIISDNIAEISGGGICCNENSTPIISDNIISSNIGSAGVGGISCINSSSAITNNTISGNVGGGIGCGGSAIIFNNIITGNRPSGSYGAGITCYPSSSLTITNNTISDNFSNKGGGIFCDTSSPKISNNIISFNSSGIYRYGSGTPILRNNCVYNPSSYNYFGLSAGIGDFSMNPIFVNKSIGNYHLHITSPCINTGWNDAPDLPEFDMDDLPRIRMGIVDVGAYEYQPIDIQIDIKPGESPNCINLKSKGLVPVAILSSSSFDAAVVDPSTITFAGAGVATKGRSLCSELRDVNGDGYIDLLLRFDTQSLILNPGAENAQLIGCTYDGEYVEGSDNIQLVGPIPQHNSRLTAYN